jgi:hypothetical protein
MPHQCTCEQCGSFFDGWANRRRCHALCRPCRFWARVAMGSADECWAWLGPISGRGYGITGFGTTPDIQLSHRTAWTFTNGDIPPGLCVCHTCDNPICCNPDHLWLGTSAENTADRVAKGRSASNHNPVPGERHGMSKLTNEDIIAIRERATHGERRVDLAREFGISYAHLKRILRRSAWSHL